MIAGSNPAGASRFPLNFWLRGFFISKNRAGGKAVAINTKGKRKVIFNDEVYYWFVRIEKDGSHRIHIMSENKRFDRVFPMADTEVPVTSGYICKLLRKGE